MCGQSQRFRDAGYTDPKFVLPVDGVPMYVAAVRSLKLTVEHQLYFVIQSHVDREYGLKLQIKEYFPGAKVITIDRNTRGMAETVQLTQPYVDQECGSLLVCCDQMVEYDSAGYNEMLEYSHISGSLLTFQDSSRDPKWTYVRKDVIEQVVNIAPKAPISDTPIVGTYHWTNSRWMYRDLAGVTGSSKNTVNGEYYVCSAVAISVEHANKPWRSFGVDRMIPLGTPEDYEAYIKNE